MEANKDLPIALFDSGVGGLTVFKAIASLSPNESLLYLGDTARVPYGTKSRETIIRYTLMAASRLMDYGAKMLVVACNTATSAALEILKETFAPTPVIGVIEPGARTAAAASKSGRIAVIGTEATINGGAYQAAITKLRPDCKVIARACTLLVPLAEEGWINGPATEATVSRYLGDIFAAAEKTDAPDTLLLGCTHFPLFRQCLQEFIGPQVAIVDSAEATAKLVASELQRLDLERKNSQLPKHRFLTTDGRMRFAHVGRLFLGSKFSLEHVELVNLSSSG